MTDTLSHRLRLAVTVLRYLAALFLGFASFRFLPLFWQEIVIRLTTALVVYSVFRILMATVPVHRPQKWFRWPKKLAALLGQDYRDDNVSPEYNRILNALDISRHSPDFFERFISERELPRTIRENIKEKRNQWGKRVPLEDIEQMIDQWEDGL